MHLTIADMPVIPLFLFKLSVSLGLVWTFYQVVLRRMTFHGLNRWYLLGYTLISFFIPFVNIGPMMADRPSGEPVLLQFIPAIGDVAGRVAVVPDSAGGSLSVWTVLLWVIVSGGAALLVRFALRWVSMIRLRNKARLIQGLGVKVYQVDGRILPFSFGNAIYINQQLHTEKEWKDILLHEYVHVRQRHTIDILIAELVCIVNWYNPFAWLIRYSIRQNLEFIADQEVLDKGVDRKGYQYHLLKVVGEPQYRLANNFNFSSLRKRIVMMNKMRSARVQLLKLLFLLPLIAVLLVSFRDKGTKLFGAHGPVCVNAAGIVINWPERTPAPGVAVRDTVSGMATKTDAKGYYKLQIPAIADSPMRVFLTFTKTGFDGTLGGRSWPAISRTTGYLATAAMFDGSKPTREPFFLVPAFGEVPPNPGYPDADEEMHRALREMDNLFEFMKMKNDHPEIGLFYVTEDARKEIVIYMDGTVERYGYPGTPDLEKLYKKYGQYPGYMATDHPTGHLAGAGYLARWAGIAEQAQKEFHPANPNVRSVLFPGDSRVIVVPVSGKPRFYDMDNDAGTERAEFERLYGKLPSCVPGAGFNSDEQEKKARLHVRSAVEQKNDTTPEGRTNAGRDSLAIGRRSTGDTASPLYVVDGNKMPAGRITLLGTPNRHPLFIIGGREVPYDTLQSINPDSIESINVYKDSAYLHRPGLVEKYGDKGKNGLVIIHLKSEKKPLCLVDGKESSWDGIKAMDPKDIESVNVLKGEAARAIYGERGKYGVVLVKLKPKRTDTRN